MYKNSEGYVDPTAGAAMATVKREENAELNDRNHRLIQVIRNIVDIAGFEIVGRVTLKHKKSGKVFLLVRCTNQCCGGSGYGKVTLGYSKSYT